MSHDTSEPRVLFFSHQLALPAYHGGCVYPYRVLSELHARGVAVDYAWLGRPLQGGRNVMRNPLVQAFISRSRVRGARRLGRFLIPDSLAGGKDDLNVGEHPPTEDEQSFAARVIREWQPSVVLIDNTYELPLLDALLPLERAKLKVAVLTHNVISERTRLYREHRQSLDFLPMTPVEEAALLRKADLILAIQDREAEVFRTMVPGVPVETVPMPAVRQELPHEQSVAGRCLFVGGFSGHNLDALGWLLDEIWPRVRAKFPTAELQVVGGVGKGCPQPPPGVSLVGALPDLEKAYAEATVCLVPLRFGTGLKIKLVEAMSYGRSVVATSVGAEGFSELEAGEVAVVADEAEEFAEGIVKLLASEEWRNAVTARQNAWLDRTLNPSLAVAPLLKFCA